MSREPYFMPDQMQPPSDDLPRVLILSNQTPQTVYAGCILLHRLFAHYPADRLFVIGQPPHPKAELLACQYRAIVPPLQRLHTTRLAALKRSLDTFGLTPNVSPRQVRKLLEDFKPDVVVSVMEERYAHAAGKYAAAEKLPLVLIVHDKPELFDNIMPWAKKQQIKSNAALYRQAVARLNISPEMERHLADLYGVPGDVMYPNRSESLTARPIEESRQLKQPDFLTIGYAGTLGYGYGDQLRQLSKSIRGSSIRLKVYGEVDRQTDPLATEFADVVDCRGLVSPPERLWPIVQAECDGVILPYSWDAAGAPVDLYRTHFPSKLPEYLALGMPVITMGPEFATGVKWGARNPQAVVRLDVEDPVYWVRELELLRDQPDRRVSLTTAAGVAGDRDFDPIKIRNGFVDRLTQIGKKNEPQINTDEHR